jgi:glycopeptide antibiotics resistance protein
MSDYIEQMIEFSLLILPFYLVMRIWTVHRKHIDKNMPREILLGIFVISMTALIMLALQPRGEMPEHISGIIRQGLHRLKTGEGINLIPFRTVQLFYHFQPEPFLINIVGNVVMFMPIGLCIPILYPKWRKGWKMILLALAFPLCIEILQLFIHRSTDIDDVIMNFIGIMLGFGLWHLFLRRRIR